MDLSIIQSLVEYAPHAHFHSAIILRRKEREKKGNGKGKERKKNKPILLATAQGHHIPSLDIC